MREYLYIACRTCGDRQKIAKDRGENHWDLHTWTEQVETWLLEHGGHDLQLVAE